MILMPEAMRESFDPEPERAPHFRILILYTARDPAIRAMRVLAKIEELLDGAARVDCEIWRVDVLEMPEVQRQIRWAGTIADLIIIASESPEVSRRVSEWLRQCVTGKQSRASALVQLFDGPALGHEEFSEALGEHLEPIAAGLDFFMHEIKRNEPGVRKVLSPNYPAADGCEWRAE